MRLYYACHDCGRSTFCEGLADVPDPPRCWTCHAIAVLSYITPNPITVIADRLGASVMALENAARREAMVVVVGRHTKFDALPWKPET